MTGENESRFREFSSRLAPCNASSFTQQHHPHHNHHLHYPATTADIMMASSIVHMVGTCLFPTSTLSFLLLFSLFLPSFHFHRLYFPRLSLFPFFGALAQQQMLVATLMIHRPPTFSVSCTQDDSLSWTACLVAILPPLFLLPFTRAVHSFYYQQRQADFAGGSRLFIC